MKIVYVIGTYPSLTTTFIDRELQALRQRVGVRVIAIRRPAGPLSAHQEQLQHLTRYLLPPTWLVLLAAHWWFVTKRPRAYFATLFYLLTRPHPGWRARGMTLLHFAAGVYAAHLIRQEPCDHIHAHFIDRAATVALVAGRLLGIPYSVSAHANDIYVNPVLLPEKLGEAKFITTCTAYNRAHLSRLVNGHGPGRLHCIYHGLDLNDYPAGQRNGRSKPLLTAVGQLKEKKGFTYLLDACRLLLHLGYDFDCQIIGEGPLRPQLERQIRDLALEGTVTLCGARPHQEVITAYQQSTLFVLPCVTSADGDRDGIPNVILEAMAMELPVVSTRHSGIPEVVQDGVNGLLVPPGDAVALATALAQLLDDPELQVRLGKNGRQTVMAHFDLAANTERLLAELLRE